jgi:hypothetical protein
MSRPVLLDQLSAQREEDRRACIDIYDYPNRATRACSGRHVRSTVYYIRSQ